MLTEDQSEEDFVMPTEPLLCLTPADYLTTQWSGGTTTQLAIAPEGALYADRAFLWRISSAVVQDETSVFTPLPDYRRWIATLDGHICLRHNGGEPLTLHPFEVHAFDGADETVCAGRCRDFNLMLRKGQAEGRLDVLRIPEGPAAPLTLLPGTETALLYCAEGSCTAIREDGNLLLKQQESLLLRDCSLRLRLSGSPSAVLMLAQMKRS